jgi:hypothetical protein
MPNDFFGGLGLHVGVSCTSDENANFEHRTPNFQRRTEEKRGAAALLGSMLDVVLIGKQASRLLGKTARPACPPMKRQAGSPSAQTGGTPVLLEGTP